MKKLIVGLLALAFTIANIMFSCGPKNQSAAMVVQPEKAFSEQSSSMMAGQSSLLSINATQLDGVKTFRYYELPIWITENADSQTTGVLSANPPVGTSGDYKFAVKVYVNDQEQLLIVYMVHVERGSP